MTAKQIMGEKVVLPRWVLTVFAPIILSAIVGLSAYSFSAGEKNRQIDQNTKEIQKKVNYEPEFIMVMQSLERIETKLDQHIAK